jgi:large repetitive protein
MAVKYQAEDATLNGPIIDNLHGGPEGTYVDFQNSSGDFIEWADVTVSTAGTYNLTFRYALGNSDRPLQLDINGVTAVANLGFSGTGAWNNWGFVTQAVELDAGTNQVRLTAIGSSGANFDYLEVTPITSTSPSVTFSVSPSAGSEAGTTAITVAATASSAVTGDQTIDLSLSGTGIDASDFVGTIPTQIAIADGTTTGSFTVNINDDSLDEGTETATFSISNPSAGIELGPTTSGDVTITDNDGAGSSDCSPISLLPCTDVRVEGDLVLNFDGTDGGLLDGDGDGTGFTIVDPASNPGNPNPTAGVVGYRPELLDVDTSSGVLKITTTSGIQFQDNNSLDNALGIGLNLPSQAIRLQTTLLDLPTAPGGFAQAGLWFGQGEGDGSGSSEDTYIKLAALAIEPGNYVLEALIEDGGVVSASQRIDIPDDLSSLTLQLFADPELRSVTAQYSTEGGSTETLTTFTDVPDDWFSFDQARLNPQIATGSFGGIFATDRLASNSEVFTFDDFSITEEAPSNPPTASNLPFDSWSIPVDNATAMAWGPDNRLYVATLFGTIHALEIDFDTRTFTDEVINTITDDEGGNRLTLGIAVDPDSTPDNVILWVGHSSGSADNGDLNSSKISRLSGPGFTQKDDVVTGLPRAIANHALNNIDFGPDGKLYAWVGGNTGAGSANNEPSEFRDRPEQAFSAAVLEIDIPKWKNDPVSFHGDVASPIGEFIDEFYARKAQELGRPFDEVQVFASGLRNTYDGVFHSNGNIYAPDNGLGVAGTVPPVPRLGDPTDRSITTLFGENPVDNPGLQPDPLNLIVEGGYYGHPNPYRDEVVFNDGSFQGFDNADADPSNDIPTGHPVYEEPLFNLGSNKSANGIIEYTADNFFGELKSDLLISNFSVGDDITRLELSPDGQSVIGSSSLLGGFTDPLPLQAGPDGRIFAGEFNGGEVTILEPLGVWRADLPQVPEAILDAGSASLDGNLYLVGGKTSDTHVSSVYVYDPGDPFDSGDDLWTSAPNLPGPAVENPAVVAFDGKVYTFGGSTQPFSGAVTNASVFDPVSSSWTSLAALPTARGGATAQVLDDKIYVIGGLGPDGASLDTVEVYDPATGLWTAGAPLQTRRDNLGAAVVDDVLYAFGGRTRDANGDVVDGALDSLEIFDPVTQTWSPGASLPTGRRAVSVGTLNDRIQVIGGEADADGNAFDLNEEYNPLTDSWRSLPAIETPRHGAAFATIDDSVDVFYVAGGGPTVGSAFTDVVEAFTF